MGHGDGQGPGHGASGDLTARGLGGLKPRAGDPARPFVCHRTQSPCSRAGFCMFVLYIHMLYCRRHGSAASSPFREPPIYVQSSPPESCPPSRVPEGTSTYRPRRLKGIPSLSQFSRLPTSCPCSRRRRRWPLASDAPQHASVDAHSFAWITMAVCVQNPSVPAQTEQQQQRITGKKIRAKRYGPHVPAEPVPGDGSTGCRQERSPRTRVRSMPRDIAVSCLHSLIMCWPHTTRYAIYTPLLRTIYCGPTSLTRGNASIHPHMYLVRHVNGALSS